MADEQHEQFLRLFTAHEQALRLHVRRLVPTRADADDVMQEIAVVLWRKFGDFRLGADFRSWAFGVARYEVLAWRRDKARGREVLSGDVVEMLADDSERDEAHLTLERALLRECLSKLTRDHRDLLLAAYQPGGRIQDVAALSGRTVGGFYQWLHRMKRMLLDCVRSRMQAPFTKPA